MNRAAIAPSSALRAGLVGCLIGLAAPVSAFAASLPVRTAALSTDAEGRTPDAASGNPTISRLGTITAFDTAATTFGPGSANGKIRDVVTVNLATGARTLVSDPGVGLPAANGPSTSPALSRDGSTVAFVSTASNLVAGDTNRAADVFVRDAAGTLTRVSVTSLGQEANGDSGPPAISGDGRFVVFSSRASNLVPNDTNRTEDVFVHDRRTGTTSLVSVTPKGTSGSGRSSTPAISDDGAVVSFESLARDLVSGDTNGVADVFVRNIAVGRTALVSVSSSNRQQNRSVGKGFRMQSDVSADGRYVVFDSDATNLTTRDRNASTDIFLRDRRARKTKLVSASSLNVQGNNDSFAPTLTPNGRYLVFRTFATNLVRGDASGEDLVVRDLRGRTTSTVDVTATGDRRIPSPVPAGGRRVGISGAGTIAVFSSASTNVVPGDRNRSSDVFLRRLDAPQTSLASPRASGSRVVRLAADDPAADRFVCRFDRGPAFNCRSRVTVPRSAAILEARAGGLGMVFDPTPLRVRVGSNDRTRPKVSITAPKGRFLRVIRGRASDRSGVRRVDVSVAYLVQGGCNHLRSVSGKLRFVKDVCTKKYFVRANGARAWSVRLPSNVRGAFRILARATDEAGNRSRSAEIRVSLS